ncbi:MAG TPA: site-2 protease family protein [Pirellulales bacterium]
MRDLVHWKLTFLRWRGTLVSLHVVFLLAGVYALYASWKLPPEPLVWPAAGGLLILFFSVLLHEFAHLYAARAIGGESEELLLWPFGGLTAPTISAWGKDDQNAAHDEMLVAAAGPAANLAVCFAVLPVLIAYSVPWNDVFALLNPIAPPGGGDLSGVPLAAALVFWTNMMLVIANMLPAMPLDGGRLMRGLLWKTAGRASALAWTAKLSQVTGVVVFIVGVLVLKEHTYAALPLSLFGVFLLMQAGREVERIHEHSEPDHFLGYDFSQGYTSLEREERQAPRAAADAPSDVEARTGPFQRWLQNRRLAKLEKERARAAEDERRFDDILGRINEVGLAGLTEDERQILKRVSERYRSRQRE